jgi:hypothetical protein
MDHAGLSGVFGSLVLKSTKSLKKRNPMMMQSNTGRNNLLLLAGVILFSGVIFGQAPVRTPCFT